jgi:glutamate synthase (NADPH/NADH) large chain
MSGGIAYVYNPGLTFAQRCNMEMIEFDEMENEDVTELKRLIQNHFDFTGSVVAEGILSNWDNAVSHFIKVMPSDYKKVLLKRRELKEVGIDNLEAVVNG